MGTCRTFVMPFPSLGHSLSHTLDQVLLAIREGPQRGLWKLSPLRKLLSERKFSLCRTSVQLLMVNFKLLSSASVVKDGHKVQKSELGAHQTHYICPSTKLTAIVWLSFPHSKHHAHFFLASSHWNHTRKRLLGDVFPRLNQIVIWHINKLGHKKSGTKVWSHWLWIFG